MSSEKSNKKPIIIIGVVLAVLLVAVIAVYAFTRPGTNPDPKDTNIASGTATAGITPGVDPDLKTISVKVVHKDGTEKKIDIETKQQFLSGALNEKDLIVLDGTFVTTVDGYTSDSSAQEWWKIRVNGKDAMVGVTEQVINDGDQIELILTVGW